MIDMDFHKVLMIEDDTFTIELNKMLLQWSKLDKYLVGVDSVAEALEYCGKSIADNLPLPKYILLDLNMPVRNGFDFMEEYQNNYANHFPDTKVIVVTSSTRSKDRQRSFSFPFVKDYIVKPLPEKYIERLIVNQEFTSKA